MEPRARSLPEEPTPDTGENAKNTGETLRSKGERGPWGNGDGENVIPCAEEEEDEEEDVMSFCF